MIALSRLRKFCSTDESRSVLLAPFSRGGDTYATDMRLIVRVPKLDSVPYDPEHDATSRSAEDIFAALPVVHAADLIPLPKLPTRPTHRERQEWFTPPSLIVGRRRLNLELLWRIAKLPKVRLAPNLTSPEQPMQFVFRGGDGLVMPMRDDAVFRTRSMSVGAELSESEKMFLELSRGSSPAS